MWLVDRPRVFWEPSDSSLKFFPRRTRNSRLTPHHFLLFERISGGRKCRRLSHEYCFLGSVSPCGPLKSELHRKRPTASAAHAGFAALSAIPGGQCLILLHPVLLREGLQGRRTPWRRFQSRVEKTVRPQLTDHVH